MFKVLRSSAGAGKTHALVKHYLSLALRDEKPSAYTAILALTFTNKAAGEMRQRVLEYLEALASEAPLDTPRTDVRDTLLREAGITPEELRRRARAMQVHMLHHWSQVAISTIDAFTRRVVMPFTRDLQLDSELRMTTEEAHYRAKAVDLLLDEAGTEPALTEVLVATCEQLLEEERSWAPAAPLLELSAELTKENALGHLALLQEMDSRAFIQARALLRERTTAFRERVRALGQQAIQAARQAGLATDDFPHGAKGYFGFFRKLADFEEWIDPGKRMVDAEATDNWATRKANPAVAAAINGLSGLFRQIFLQVNAWRETDMRDHAIRCAILRDLLPTASLNSIALQLARLKREEGVSFFSDLTRKVMAIVQEEPAPFLYERLGERYNHFLIDEFQDTSLMQWHALLPLVENALANGGSVLLVGDAKQAIYRWRNGEARQFVRLPEIFGEHLLARGPELAAMLRRAHVEAEPLAANYRSAHNIIAFNNNLTGLLKLSLGPDEQAVYAGHEQAARGNREGYVEVACYGPPESGEIPPPWALMVQAVKDCLHDGFRPADLAVLVRTGAQGAMASRLLAEQGWEVASPDGLALNMNPAVQAVVCVMAWLHRPADAQAVMAVQAMAKLGRRDGTVDPFAGGKRPKDCMQQWRRANPRIAVRLPLVTLICRIAEALGHDPAGNLFVMGLVNEAHAFLKSGGDDLPAFLEHWNAVAGKRSAGGAPGKEAIQVMTVHKAKGLQFPVVILPEAGKDTRGKGNERIWITPDARLGAPPSALVKMTRTLLEADIPELLEEERLGKLDQLDVLYVAITRPEERLYISVEGTGQAPLPAAIRKALGLEEGATWTSGSRLRNHETPRKEAKEPEPPMELTPRTERGGRDLAIKREAPPEWDPAEPDPLRRHGNAVHAVLARVRTMDDLPAAVAMESAAWGLEPAVSGAIAEQLAHLLAKPELQPFFGAGLEVRTEATLIDAQGHAHRPDRVVCHAGVCRVLDIKTGAPAADHGEQVRGYMRLLQAVEKEPVEGWLLYVRDGEMVPVMP